MKTQWIAMWTCSLSNCKKPSKSEGLMSLWLLDDHNSCVCDVSFLWWMNLPGEQKSKTEASASTPARFLHKASGSTYHPRSWIPSSWQHWRGRQCHRSRHWWYLCPQCQCCLNPGRAPYVQASHCSGFSCCRAWGLGRTGFNGWGSRGLELGLRSCGTWA